MLSRLISLLRRIPAVKWAFTRLRPEPHSGSIDVTPVAADVSPIIAEAVVAEAAATQVADISATSGWLRCITSGITCLYFGTRLVLP